MPQTLYIALCDTNFADRKQMERLLKRETDKRKESCVIYMDTYGNRDSILENPRVYDAYFLDLPDVTYSAYNLAKDIQAKGILSPIIFCSSFMNYRECGELLPNTVFLDKPIVASALSLVLDEIIVQKQEQHIPTIELRNATSVFYLKESEIAYFKSRKNSLRFTIHLADGSTAEAEGFIENLYQELIPFKYFFPANKTTLVNARYVEKVDLFHVTMKDGTTFRLTATSRKEVLTRIDKI